MIKKKKAFKKPKQQTTFSTQVHTYKINSSIKESGERRGAWCLGSPCTQIRCGEGTSRWPGLAAAGCVPGGVRGRLGLSQGTGTWEPALGGLRWAGSPRQGLRENTLKLVRDTGTEKPAAQLRPLSCISGSQYVSLKARTQKRGAHTTDLHTLVSHLPWERGRRPLTRLGLCHGTHTES